MLRYRGDGLSMPGHLVLDANLSTALPRFAWATNRLGVATSGSGLAEDGWRRAVGEYFERRHFYLEVRGDERGTLAMVKDDALRRSLETALSQTASARVRGHIGTHRFAMSSVLRLPQCEPVDAPTILFSVTGESLDQDCDFLVCRDTTGCAAHFDLPRAIDGALREFAERQYLLRYWLRGRGARDITAQAMGRLSHGARDLAGKLSRCGEMHFLDISGGELAGGAVVLAVYRGSSDPYVRYCVGLACETDAGAASDRAIKELWQSHVFLRNMANVPDPERLVHDRYHTYFLSCNNLATADAMLSGIDACAADSIGPQSGDLVDAIQARFRMLLCYARQVNVLSRRLWCVRVVSSEAFLHMDNSRHFNLACAFADSFRTEVRADRLQTMVPFP